MQPLQLTLNTDGSGCSATETTNSMRKQLTSFSINCSLIAVGLFKMESAQESPLSR